MPDPPVVVLQRALQAAVTQRDRAVALLRELGDPRAEELVRLLDAETSAVMEDLARTSAPPDPADTNVRSLFTGRPLAAPTQLGPRIRAHGRFQELDAVARARVLESRLEVAHHLSLRVLPLLAWALARATGGITGTPLARPPETYEEVLRLVVGLPDAQRADLFRRLDEVGAAYPTTLGRLWTEARSLIQGGKF